MAARAPRYAGYSPVSTAYVEVLCGRAARLAGRDSIARRHWRAALIAADRYQTPYYAGLAMEQLAATAGRTERETLSNRAAAIFSANGAQTALARISLPAGASRVIANEPGSP